MLLVLADCDNDKAEGWLAVQLINKNGSLEQLQLGEQMSYHFGRPSKFIPLPNLVALYLSCQLWGPPISQFFFLSFILIPFAPTLAVSDGAMRAGPA